MPYGRYWLTPEGETLDVAGSEHANIAKIVMLNIDNPEDRMAYAPIKNVWKAMTDEEASIHLRRGVDPNVINFFQSAGHPDARIWALREWGWVRTDDSLFNCWILDDQTLDTIRANKRYWMVQRPGLESDTVINVNEEATGERYTLNVERMLNPAATAEALIRVAAGAQFRNPKDRKRIKNPRIRTT